MGDKPCLHLEKELPSMEQGLNKRILSYVPDLDMLGIPVDIPEPPSAAKIRGYSKKLAQLGLLPHQILVLLERTIFNKTFREITQEHGFTNIKTTFYIYKQAMKHLETVVNKTKAGTQ